VATSQRICCLRVRSRRRSLSGQRSMQKAVPRPTTPECRPPWACSPRSASPGASPSIPMSGWRRPWSHPPGSPR